MRKQWCLQSVTISVEVTLQQPIGSSLNTSRSTAYKADALTVSLNWMLKPQVWLSKFYVYIPRWNLYTCWEKTLSKESRVSCSFSSFTKLTLVSGTLLSLPFTLGEWTDQIKSWGYITLHYTQKSVLQALFEQYFTHQPWHKIDDALASSLLRLFVAPQHLLCCVHMHI